jgi:hypothetical protein
VTYAYPARGLVKIESLHRQWTGEATGKQLKVLDASSAGSLGWCLVAYSEGEATGNGTSLSFVKLQPDGKWLIKICSLTSDVPPLLV